MHRNLYLRRTLRAVPEIILRGGPQTFLSGAGGGCFVDSVSEGWGGGGGVTCPGGGGQDIFDPYWGGLIKALTCPGGRGALTLYVSWGWRGLKKMRPPP